MNNQLNGPDPDTKKVTNQDEQEVVVNHSTVEEHGYDEPVSHETFINEDEEQKIDRKNDEEKKKSDSSSKR
jgi:hypothetical protein